MNVALAIIGIWVIYRVLRGRLALRNWPLALVASLALLLGACGQKGPLYLPNAHKAPVAPNPGAATPSSVPAQATPPAQPKKPQSQSSQPDDSQPAAGDSSATGQSPAA